MFSSFLLDYTGTVRSYPHFDLQGDGDTLNMTQVDINYRKLRCDITPLEEIRDEYSMVKEMVLKVRRAADTNGRSLNLTASDPVQRVFFWYKVRLGALGRV